MVNLDYLLTEGHHVLASGRHSLVKVECDKILDDDKSCDKVSQQLGEKALVEVFDIRTVPKAIVGVATGGIKPAAKMADYFSGNGINCNAVDSEKDKNGGISVVKSQLFNYSGGVVHKSDTAIVVDDVFTTGGSVLKVIDSLRYMDVETIAIAAIYNRSRQDTISGIPIVALEHKYLPTFSAEECVCHTP